MNRRHNNETVTLNKKRNKEIKQGLKTESMPIVTLVKRAPSRTETVQKARKKTAEKNIAIAKAKAKSKRSKRTSTHEGIINSTPAHSHPEGSRWICTLKKQNIEKNILSQKRGRKIKNRNPKKAA